MAVGWGGAPADRALDRDRGSGRIHRDASRITPFFTSVVTIAICLLIIEVFRAADDLAAELPARERIGTLTALVLLFWVMGPSVALGDNRDGDTDTDLAALASAAAGSAAGAAAFDRALRKRFPPRQLPEYSGPQGQDVPKDRQS